jgi:hypothetical protein
MFRFVRDFVAPIDKAHGLSDPASHEGWPNDVFRHRPTQEHLAKELLDLPLGDFVKLKYWDGHLRMAFHAMSDSDLQSAVLTHWLESGWNDARFMDLVAFYIIRPRHLHTEIGDAWIRASVALAESTNDRSLVESLVWILGRSISEYPSFATLAHELGQQSSLISKALNETVA